MSYYSFSLEGVDFNLTLSSTVITFPPSDVIVDFMFLVFQEGTYEAVEGISLFLEAADGELAVDVSAGRGQVLISDSDSKNWFVIM